MAAWDLEEFLTEKGFWVTICQIWFAPAVLSKSIEKYKCKSTHGK